MSVARNLARIGKQSAIYGAGSIAATLLGIVLLPLYTRELTPAQFGDAELALRIVLLVAIVARLGLVNSFFRFFFDYEDPERRRRVFQTAFWALQVTTLVWALITALASRWLGQSVFTTPEAGQDLVLMIALGVYVTVNYELTSALFRVQERPVAFSVRTVINLIATAVLSYIFLVQLHMGPVGLLLGAYLGQALVYLGVLVEQRSWLGFGLDRPLLHSMLKFGVPLMPAGAAMWAVTLINRPIVLAVSTPATLGILGAVLAVGGRTAKLFQAIEGLPRLGEVRAVARHRRPGRLDRRGAQLTVTRQPVVGQARQHLALSDDVRCLCQHCHDGHRAYFNHHLKGSGIKEVPDQNAWGIAKDGIGRLSGAAQPRLVHHIVMQKGGGVNKFNNGGKFGHRWPPGFRLLVAKGLARKQKEGRSHSLAACFNNVAGHLLNKKNLAEQPPLDNGIHLLHAFTNQGERLTVGVV